jgi:hypothetical protein
MIRACASSSSSSPRPWSPAALLALVLIGYDSYQRERSQLIRDSLGTARALSAAVDAELTVVKAALFALATSPHLASGDLAAFHAQGDAGNLRRGKGDDLGRGVAAINHVEVMEVAPCRAGDDHSGPFHAGTICDLPAGFLIQRKIRPRTPR